MSVGPLAFRVASEALIGMAVRYPEITHPTNGILDDRHFKSHALKDVRATALSGGFLAAELIDKAREIEEHYTTRSNPFSGFPNPIPVHFNPRTNRISYVIATISESKRVSLPLTIPRHMVTLLDAGEDTTSNTVRLLGQIAGVYSRALDLPDIPSDGRDKIIQSLRILFSIFCATVRLASLDHGYHAEQHGDANADPS